MHANTLNRLDGSLAHISPLYKAGNILTSFKTIDCLAILDMDEERLVWLSPGPFEGQHQPELLQDGNLILFNNNRFSDYSEVLVWNPLKRQTVWYYLGDPPTSFFSKCCGIAQKLPNGDILATSTGQGRVIEITPDKRIVWEYINPHRIGTNGETIASLWEMERLPKDFPVDWAVTPKKPVPSE